MIRRIAIIAISAVAVLLATATSAWAHVTVSAPGAVSGGGDQLITFRVPTESDTASTTGLKLQLPTDTPIASVLVQPVPGWTATITTAKLATPITTDDGQITEAVSEIDWKAGSTADGIAPGQFQEFILIAGQVPDADSLTFKVIQDYSDGTTVAWTDVAAKGSKADLEHPAPVLDLSASAAKSDSGSSNTGPIILSIIALVLAAGALGVAIVTRAKRAAVTTTAEDAT
jgi:uncharacterized protein YcnI